MTMFDQMHQKAQEYPDSIALSLNDKHLTYKQLLQEIEEAKTKFIQFNINQQDKVALLLPNIMEHVILFYALNQMKITTVLLHPLSSPKNIKERLDFVKPTKIVMLDALVSQYMDVIDLDKLVVVSIEDSFTGIKRLALKVKYGLSYRSHRWNNISHSKKPMQTPVENKDAIILFSSGTTGQQKGISLSNDAFIALANQLKNQFVLEPNKDAMYCVLPFFHGFGLGITMHAVLAIGGRCVLVPRLQKRTMIQQLLKEKPSYIAGVPYLYRMLLQSEEFKTADLSFIKRAFIGGELVSPHLINEFNSLLKTNHSTGCMQVGYGTTETVTAVTLSDPFDATPNCVGKPFEGNKIMIIKEDDTEASPLEKGEICISGPILMNGYYQNPTLTTQVMKQHKGKVFYHTGDIGHLDNQGRVYYSHRKDELLKVNGYFVNPLEVEEALYHVLGVMETKVFVNQQGELCTMMVLNKIQSLNLLKEKTTQAIVDLDRWSKPTHYYVVDDIPKNEMRKTDLKQIHKELIDRKEIQFLLEWTL